MTSDGESGMPHRKAASSLWSMRGYLRPYRYRMLAMLVLATASTATALAVPRLIQLAIDGPISDGRAWGLWLVGAAVIVLGLSEAVIVWLRRFIQARVALSLEADMRTDLYSHMQRLHSGFHDRWQTGQLLARVTSDLSSMRRFMAWGLIFGLMGLFTYVAVTIQLIVMHWQLGLLVGTAAIPLFIVSRNFARAYIVASRRMQEQQGEVATLAEQAAQGIRVIKAFGRAGHMQDQFGAEADTLRELSVRRMNIAARSWAKFNVIPNVTLAIVLVGGSIAVSQGQLTIGGLVAFVTLQLLLVGPVETMGWIIANGNEAMTAADRVRDVFDTKPAIVDRPGARELARTAARGHVRFADVGFSYEAGADPVLSGVELDVKPGETLAIAGATGSGKTTLVSLVPRLYDVSAGKITVDGHDVRDVTLRSLRTVVTTAFEDPTLFSMSVRENLTLGHESADDHDIAEALRVSQAEFVYDLPHGLDTRVGEQGLSLSGGQRQRLALARAVVVKPAVLVLDDPLSALDVHTEELVERALADVLRGTTALIVVHRPSTVLLADRVALLRDGAIDAIGTHRDLLNSSPAYARVLSAEAEDITV